MKMMQTSIRVATLVALSVLLLCGLAQAQGSRVTFQGKFTLPYEARWGKALLPAGEYSMTITSGNSQLDYVTVRSAAKTAIILVGETSRCDACNASELVVVRSSGQRAIRALELPGQRALFYHAQPDRDAAELARGSQSTERVRIAAGASH